MSEVRRFFFLLLAITLLLSPLACSNADINGELSGDTEEENLEDETAAEPEDEETAPDEENLTEDQETSKKPASSSGSSGFKHNVIMDVDGEIEKNTGEEWWDIN